MDQHSAGRVPAPFILAVLFCALGLLIAGLVGQLYQAHFPVNTYLTIHTVFETFSIIVSFTVFVVGWYGYRRNANRQNLTIGLVFLSVGMLDLAHTLSYNGMPPFLTPNSVSKASTLWITARLVNSIGLLVAAFVAPTPEPRRLKPGVLLAGALIFTLGLILVIVYIPAVHTLMYTPGVGQTRLKIGLEWLVIATYTAAAVAFGRREPGERSVVLLQTALIVSIFSELSFTLYVSAYDAFNLMGHILKIAAYYLIFRAIFVSSFEKPYNKLSHALDQLERSFSLIGTALAGSLELGKALTLIAELAADILNAKSAAVMLLSDGELLIQAQSGLPDQPGGLTTDHTAATLAVRSRKPVVIADMRELCERKETCYMHYLDSRLGVRSLVAAPIVFDSDVLGAIEVYSTRLDAFDQEDADLLSGFARQAAVAIRNSMSYERERTVAETLQRSLLPAPPSVHGLDIAVRYEPADQTAHVGGDLYDVFLQDQDHLAIIIGDVAGHGLQAASAMAVIEYTLKSALMQGQSPDSAVHSANLNLLRSTSADPLTVMFATVFAGVLDLKTWRLCFVNAGHPAPLILKETCALSTESSIPIGISESAHYVTHCLDLSDAHGIFLYTDGVVEARRQREMFGQDRLVALCNRLTRSGPKEILDEVIREVRDWSGMLQDDVAMLSVHWRSTHPGTRATNEDL